MTRHLRLGRVLVAASVLLSAGALRLGVTDYWLAAFALGYGAFLAGLGACVEYRVHRQELARHEEARRRAVGEEPLDPFGPFVACCALWHVSRTVHGADCTRVRESGAA